MTSAGKEGQCKPVALCVGITEAEEASDVCSIDDSADGDGVCCAERLTNEANVKFADHNIGKEDTQAAGVSILDIENSIGSR